MKNYPAPLCLIHHTMAQFGAAGETVSEGILCPLQGLFVKHTVLTSLRQR